MADGSILIDTKVDLSGATKGMSALGSVADTALKGVTAALGAVTGAASAAAGYMIKVGSSFEAGMSQVAATMGITVAEIESGSKEFKKLEQAAKDMGSTTQFSATQASEALNYLALAGYDADKAVAALPDVLNLAAAGGLDLGYASDLVTDSMSALGMETDQLSGFVDQLSKTSQKSNTNISQLGQAILTVGGTAKNLAGGTVELNTALGILADNGIKGAEGGTALRNVILSLSAPTAKAAKDLKKLGIEAFDADGNMRPLNEVFEDFNAKLSTLSQKEQINALNNIFNKVDLKSVNALLAGTVKDFDSLSVALSAAGISGEKLDGLFESLASGCYYASDKAAFMDEVMSDWSITQQQAEVAFSGLNSALGKGVSRFDELSQMIRESTGSAQEQANTLNYNLQGALTILGSTVEGLGISFYDNIKGSATNAVKTFTRTLSSREFKTAFNEFSQSSGEIISQLGDMSEKALPLAAEGFAFLAGNLREIIGVTGAVYLGFKSFSIISTVAGSVQGASAALAVYSAVSSTVTVEQAALNGALTLGQVAVGVLTGEIGLATAAQAAWNLVLSANPVGLVAAGVGALTVGLAAYFALTKDSTDATQRLCDEADNLVESSQEMRTALQDSARQRQEEKRAMEAEAGAAKVLADRLSALAEKTGKTAEEKQSMLSMVEQLNQAVPGLNLAYDAENDLLSKQQDEIHGVIDANLEMLKVKAAQEDQIKIAQDIYQAEKNLSDLEKERFKIVYELNKLEAELAVTAQDANKAFMAPDAVANYKRKFDELVARLKGVNAEIKDAENNIRDLNGEFDSGQKFIDQHAQKTQAAAESLEGMGDAGANAADKIGASAEAIAGSFQQVDEKTAESKKHLEDYQDTATNVFSVIEEKSAQSVTEMITNMEANQQAVNDWADNLTKAAERGVDQGLLLKLREAGPEAAGYVRNLVDASDNEIARLNEVFRSGTEAARNASDAELTLLKNSALGLVDEAVSGITGSLQDGASRAGSAAASIKDSAVGALAGLDSAFRSIGEAAAEGLGEGIQGKINSIVRIAGMAADSAVSAMRKKLEINSPSKKVMREVGSPIMEGVGKGFEKSLPDVERRMQAGLSDMVGRMEAAAAAESSVIGTNTLAREPANISSSSLNVGGVKTQVNYYGGGSPADADILARRLGQKTRQALRAKGVPSLGW